MIRIGVLGAGSHSSELHGVALKQLADERPGRFEIAAVCDLDLDRARRYRERFGAGRIYGDMEAMLAGETFDALMAVTPIPHTEAIVSRLLSERIPLLIEKPPGETPEATERLRALAARYEVPHMVSFNRRFAPALARAREWMAADPAARRPLFIFGRMLRRRRLEPDFITGTGVHMFDAILSILGRPSGVSSVSCPTGEPGVAVTHASIDFPDGRRAACLIAPDAACLEETYEIIGDGWSMLADTQRGRLRIESPGAETITWSVAPDPPRPLADGNVAEMDAFLAAVEGRGPWWPSLADSLASMRLTAAVAAGGRCVFD